MPTKTETRGYTATKDQLLTRASARARRRLTHAAQHAMKLLVVVPV